MKTEMIHLPVLTRIYENGEVKSRYEPSPLAVEAIVLVEEGLWVHRTLDTVNSVIPRGRWTISAGPNKASMISYLPSKRIALRIGKALVGFPGVDWTKITNGEQLPPDLLQIMMILRSTGGDWEREIKSLEELSERRRKEV